MKERERGPLPLPRYVPRVQDKHDKEENKYYRIYTTIRTDYHHGEFDKCVERHMDTYFKDWSIFYRVNRENSMEQKIHAMVARAKSREEAGKEYLPKAHSINVPRLLWSDKDEEQRIERNDYNRLYAWKRALLKNKDAYPEHIKELLNVSFYNRVHSQSQLDEIIHDSELDTNASDESGASDTETETDTDIDVDYESMKGNNKRSVTLKDSVPITNKRRKICCGNGDEWRMKRLC